METDTGTKTYDVIEATKVQGGLPPPGKGCKQSDPFS